MSDRSEHALSVNTRYIKIGKVEVPFSMELGSVTQIKFAGEDVFRHFEAVKIEKKDNQDGTYDEVYIVKESI